MIDLTLLGAESVRPLKRSEYDRLVAAGVFDDERVELLHGILVRMTPQGGPHATSISKLNLHVVRALGDRADIRSHSPYAASDDSEPEPDLAVVPLGDYRGDHPDRAFLLVEASDSSLLKDRKIKAPLYAASRVQEYWILDLDAGEVEVHRDPGPEGYRSITRHGKSATLSLLAFPDVQIAVSSFLP